MLHIILLLLKIIGWILLVILGILILLLLVVLFSSLKYKVFASAEGTLDSVKAEVEFRWLFRIIRGSVSYQKDQLKYEVKAFSKRILGDDEKEPKEVVEEAADALMAVDEACTDSENTSRNEMISKSPEISEVPEDSEDPETSKIRKIEERQESTKQQENTEPQTEEKKSTFSKMSEMYHKILAKISKVFQKIKYTFRKICDKIKSLNEKKEQLTAFIENEVHVAAFHKAVREIKRLLRFLKPKRLNANLHFGFEDPYVTGQVLAGAAILYPFTEDHVSLQPDFEQAVLEGDVEIKGRIRLSYFVVVFIHLLFDKNIRQTYKDIRKMMNQ